MARHTPAVLHPLGFSALNSSEPPPREKYHLEWVGISPSITAAEKTSHRHLLFSLRRLEIVSS